MNKGFVIAIDGPVAAGKGTIAPMLAKRLSGFYLYTGAVYRCLALCALEDGIDPSDEKTLLKTLDGINIKLSDEKIYLDDCDVTNKIKQKDVARVASLVASLFRIRQVVIKKQRDIAVDNLDKGKIVVAEGRDTATVVFKNAAMKIFLTADIKIRVKRRLMQMQDLGEKVSENEMLASVEQRDRMDTTREIDPLVINPKDYGYFIIDNSTLSESETVDIIVAKLKGKNLI